MPSFEERSGKIRVTVCVARVRRTATFPSRAEARAWAKSIEGELISGLRGASVRRTVAQALQRYSAEVSVKKRGARWEQIRLKKLGRELSFSGKLLEHVTADDLASWRDGSPLAPNSIRREWALVRAVFGKARDQWGWLLRSPFQKERAPARGRPRSRRVSDEEIATVVQALGWEPDDRPRTTGQFVAVAVVLAVETAMRKGELLTIDRGSIIADGRVAHLDTTKNGDERDVPLSGRAVQLVALLPEAGPLIPVHPGTFDVTFRRARDRCGMDWHFHDLRREATTRLAAKVDPMVLAKITGHRDLRVLLGTYYAPRMADVAKLLG